MLSELACCAGWGSSCRCRPMPMPHTWASCSSLMSLATSLKLSGNQTRSCTVYTVCLRAFGGASNSGSMAGIAFLFWYISGMLDGRRPFACSPLHEQCVICTASCALVCCQCNIAYSINAVLYSSVAA